MGKNTKKKSIQDIERRAKTIQHTLKKAQHSLKKAQHSLNKAMDNVATVEKNTRRENHRLYDSMVTLGTQMTDAEVEEMLETAEISNFIMNVYEMQPSDVRKDIQTMRMQKYEDEEKSEKEEKEEKKTIIENMKKQNGTARYQEPGARDNFEYYIQEYWEKDVCENCDNARGTPVACQHSKKVHKHCSYLCSQCKNEKEMVENRPDWCRFCCTQNLLSA
jgi:hypothetical protein